MDEGGCAACAWVNPGAGANGDVAQQLDEGLPVASVGEIYMIRAADDEPEDFHLGCVRYVFPIVCPPHGLQFLCLS